MILVGLPAFDSIEPQCVRSIEDALRHVDDIKVMYRYGLNICAARNELCQAAIELEASHLFFMDVDMVFPKYALRDLLMVDKDIVGGYYHRKITGFMSNVFAEVDGKVQPIAVGSMELRQVDSMGTGCMLIETPILKTMEFPWFNYAKSEQGQRLQTEDVVFCDKARKLGYEVWCHGGVRCDHIGKFIVSPSEDGERVTLRPIR